VICDLTFVISAKKNINFKNKALNEQYIGTLQAIFLILRCNF